MFTRPVCALQYLNRPDDEVGGRTIRHRSVDVARAFFFVDGEPPQGRSRLSVRRVQAQSQAGRLVCRVRVPLPGIRWLFACRIQVYGRQERAYDGRRRRDAPPAPVLRRSSDSCSHRKRRTGGASTVGSVICPRCGSSTSDGRTSSMMMMMMTTTIQQRRRRIRITSSLSTCRWFQERRRDCQRFRRPSFCTTRRRKSSRFPLRFSLSASNLERLSTRLVFLSLCSSSA